MSACPAFCFILGFDRPKDTPASVLESTPLTANLLAKLNGAYHWPAQVD
jgi:hypothetical protein